MAQLHTSNTVATVCALCLWSVCFFLLFSVAYSTPPGNPISCNSSYCTVSNALSAFPDRSICKVGSVVYPKSEDEILSAVAMASKKRTKVKVVTRTSHSIPKLVCPDGEDGLLISTHNLDRILDIDVSTSTITVEPGVLLRDLTKHAAESGLALPAGPYWWGVTIGGLISTGAHGSGWLGNGSAVHDYVHRNRIVTPARPDEGNAKVRILENDDPDLNAAKLSLGVLGVISQVTLRLEPLFKRSITFLEKTDSDLIQQALTFGNEHEFGEITWYPNQRKAVYRVDDRVPCHVFGNGLNNFTAFRAVPSTVLAARRSLEEIQESTKNATWQCITARTSTEASIASAYGFANDDRNAFMRYPIIGYQHHLQSAGSCLDSPSDGLLTACPADPRIKSAFYHQSAFSIGISKAENFIEDIQKLRDLEPQAFCNLELYDGILIRYAKASKAYLGKQEDSLEFDLTYYRSTNPYKPRLFEDILEEVEQMAVFKYGGKPHWGKNRNVGFIGVIDKYETTAAEFLKVKKSYDPLGLFSSKWTDQILGLDQSGVSIVKEGCALEGLCICSEDIHCAPEDGYVCRTGKVYTDARVCTDINRISHLAFTTFTDM